MNNQQVISISTDIFSTDIEFETYILNRYSVPGQVIIGLSSLRKQITLHKHRKEIEELIISDQQLQLTTGIIPIREQYEYLYDIITDTIKIPNGDESELWFAIAFNGKVKGAVAGESGIEADVEVGDETISLKNYNKTTFDFGSLHPGSIKLMNSFLELGKYLTGLEITKSKGRTHVNNLLDKLDTDSIESDVRYILKIAERENVVLLKNIASKLNDFYELSPDNKSLVAAFCNIIDNMLDEKINSVKWWGMIIKSNKTLFLESSSDLLQSLSCRNNRLSPAISCFHQNKLFVLGSQLSTKVTKKKQE